MSENTHTSRIASYKNAGQGVGELRRKRQELSVALRKQARDEQLLKRRALSPEGGDEEDAGTSEEQLPTPEEIVKGLKSNDLALRITFARAARRMLSREKNPPISIMVQAGVIKPLVQSLERDDCADLQFEAAWALTNIASGTRDNTMAVVDGGAVPRLVPLLSNSGSVGEQAAWALGNIAGDGPATRDIVLAAGMLPALLPSLVTGAPRTRLRTAVWTYSNLCRNKNPMVNFELVAPALPHISELLAFDDNDVLADACWALSYLSDGPNERIEAVQSTPGLLSRLVALLNHAQAAVKTPALRALGNMVTGSDEQTDRCLEAGCLAPLAGLLRCSKPSLAKEAAWALSNILAGSAAQIQRAIQEGMLAHLRQALLHADARCQKEAAWAVTNLCSGGNPEHLDALIGAGILEPYAALLGAPDHRTVVVVLDGITNLLQAAEKFGQVEALCIALEEMGTLDKIEALQHHDNEQVYAKTVHIMDTYFSETDDAVAPPPKSGDEYQFNTGTEAQNTAHNMHF